MAFFALYLSRFAVGLGATMLVTFIPIYTKLLEATPFWIGLFTTGYAISGFFTILPVGWISDRYSKKMMLIGAMVVSALSYGAFMLVSGVHSLTLARILQGVAITAGGMVSLALVGEIAGEGERAQSIGIYNAVRNFSSGIGSVAGGWLYTQFGFSVPYTLLIILSVASCALLLKYLPPDETRIVGFTFGEVLSSRRVQAMGAFRTFYAFGVTMMRTYIPIYAGVTLDFTPVQVGTVVAAEKIINMLCQPYTGKVSDRFGRFPLVLLGGSLYALGSFLAFFEHSFLTLLLVNGFLGLSDSLREPASMALFADEGQGSGITSAFSVRSVIWRPGMILAPMIGGAVMNFMGINYVFVAAMAFVVFGLLGLRGILLVQGRLEREVLMS